jgi:hypothetical protein
MARLRRPEPEPAGEPVPERLARCYVEEWVDAGEDGDPLIVAGRRHRAALRAWLAEHPTAERPPYGRPTWRTR